MKTMRERFDELRKKPPTYEELIDFIEQELKKEREEIVEYANSKRKMGGEFGFCEHCKLHKGDFEHDYGMCKGHDDALDDIINLIKNRV